MLFFLNVVLMRWAYKTLGLIFLLDFPISYLIPRGECIGMEVAVYEFSVFVHTH